MKKFHFFWNKQGGQSDSPFSIINNFDDTANINIDRLSCVLHSLEKNNHSFDEYVQIKNHPGLPEWWHENRNVILAPRNMTENLIPSIHIHPGLPPPQDYILFLNGKSNFTIMLWGSGGVLYLDVNSNTPGGSFQIGGGLVFIGSNVRSTGRLNINCRNNGVVVIESDCLIASDVTFMTDDCHAIISLESGKRINTYGGAIWVKNHVWIAEKARLMGDSLINQNCIIGYNSFVRGVDIPANSIVAGTPGRIVKSNITWDFRDLPPEDFNI